jgi:hypothetical protein
MGLFTSHLSPIVQPSRPFFFLCSYEKQSSVYGIYTEGAAGVPAPRRPTGDPGRPPLLAPTVGPPLLPIHRPGRRVPCPRTPHALYGPTQLGAGELFFLLFCFCFRFFSVSFFCFFKIQFRTLNFENLYILEKMFFQKVCRF